MPDFRVVIDLDECIDDLALFDLLFAINFVVLTSSFQGHFELIELCRIVQVHSSPMAASRMKRAAFQERPADLSAI
jgi:hypothetical protein